MFVLPGRALVLLIAAFELLGAMFVGVAVFIGGAVFTFAVLVVVRVLVLVAGVLVLLSPQPKVTTASSVSSTKDNTFLITFSFHTTASYVRHKLVLVTGELYTINQPDFIAPKCVVLEIFLEPYKASPCCGKVPVATIRIATTGDQ
jgi:hypothetical protein